jgi:dihydroorotase
MENTVKIKKILFHGGEVVDLVSQKRVQQDMAIVNGKIDKLGKIDPEQFSGETRDISGSLIVPGLIDMHVHLREPGREDEETIESGCRAAMAGGFTAICAMPNTDPPCDTQEVVRFIKKRAESLLVDVYPIAAVTKKRAGEEISEMADLLKAGAVAFSDDGTPVFNSAVMRNALEYASMYKIPIIDHCEDQYLFSGGHMNESKMSTLLGLTPIPDVGEEILIARDIALARYTTGKVHIAHLSTKRGLDHIRRAKSEGISVTCEVTPHHLTFTDEDLADYSTNLKMNPPLRTADDVEALKGGLSDGSIDAIASDHAPHSIEEKDVEFDAAPFGIIGLETMLGVILTSIVNEGILSLEDALHKMSIAPRQILNIPIPQIKEGTDANLTIINPAEKWTVDADQLLSLSKNTPYGGWTCAGRAIGVLNKGFFWER